jgi:hypothetical protein
MYDERGDAGDGQDRMGNVNEESNSALRLGVVAMIDALGFKGIWQRTPKDPAAAIRTLEVVTSVVRNVQNYLQGAWVNHLVATANGQPPTLSVMSLSDSIVIAAELPENAGAETDGGENFQTVLLDMVCQAAGQAIRFAAQAEVPLVYRGVVAAGSLAVKKNTFLIGPAIDEAAELMQLADGAFVWLAASALEIEPPNHRPHAWQSMAIDYEVPLKGGARLRTIALSPYVDTIELAERALIRSGYERAMQSNRIDVQIKRQNTLRFLDHVDALPRVPLTQRR